MSLALRLVAHGLPHTASWVCAHSAPESNTASSSLRSGSFKTSFSWAVGLGKNVNVISQTVRTCMQIPVPMRLLSLRGSLNSVPQPQLSALTRHSGHFWYSKLTAWIRLWHTGRSTLSCAHKTACVRARTQWRCPVPSKSHRYDVPEVEFKKMTPILRDFCLSGLKRVLILSCSANSKSSSTLAQGVTLVRKPRSTASVTMLDVKRCKSSKTKA